MDVFTSLEDFIENHYSLKIQRLEQLTGKIYKVVTRENDYLLKFSSGDDEFIMKQLFAHKVMPGHVLPIYRTAEKEHRVLEGEKFWYLTDFVPVIPVPLEKQVGDYVGLLRKLHKETEIMVDMSDDEITRMHDDEYRILQESYSQLQKTMEDCELKRDRSPYDWYFMMVYPMMYGMLHHANEALEKFYKSVRREKKLPMCLIHGDVNVANLLVGEKSTNLINFERSKFGMSGTDMVEFIHHYHQVPGLQYTILDYLKTENRAVLRNHFFFKSLCLDLQTLETQGPRGALERISLLNELLAPHMMALQVFDEYHRKPPPAPKKNPLQEVMAQAKK